MLKTMALLLAKRETNYGVDALPTAAQNAILCELPEFEVMGKKLELADVKSFFGGRSVINVGTGLKVSFTTAIRGCGGEQRSRLSRPTSGLFFGGATSRKRSIPPPDWSLRSTPPTARSTTQIR